MVTSKSLLLGALIALGLTACDATAEDAGATQTAQNAAALDDSLPEGISLPKNTRITSKEKVDQASGEGWFIYLESSQSAAELERHFKAEAEKAGFSLSIKTNSGGQRQLHGERKDGMQFDFAAAEYEGGSTRVSMAVGHSR
jgi:hypothetical protein